LGKLGWTKGEIWAKLKRNLSKSD